MQRRFEYQEGTSSKFWKIELDGFRVTTWWGRLGTAGQSKEKEFDSADKAQFEYDKLIAEKLGKGYVEVSSKTCEQSTSGPAEKQIKTTCADHSDSTWSWAWFGRRRFELLDQTSVHHWEIQLLPSALKTWQENGGNEEQSKTSLFGSTAESIQEYSRLIAEKTAAGYVESTSEATPSEDLPRARANKFITDLIENPGNASEMLTDEEGTYGADKVVFWVDWKGEDEWIAAACEEILQTGHLTGELVATQTDEGYEVYSRYKDKRVQVPLSYSEDDRHITICALNRILSPDYEVRFCIDSGGADTLAFLPLPVAEWKNFEQRYGDAFERRFYKIKAKPNLFTDSVDFDDDGRSAKQVRQVAFASRDLDAGETINDSDFQIRSVDAELAPNDAMLAIEGAEVKSKIKKGEPIKRSDISKIPGSKTSYST